jgi:hypothetical protein
VSNLFSIAAMEAYHLIGLEGTNMY